MKGEKEWKKRDRESWDSKCEGKEGKIGAESEGVDRTGTGIRAKRRRRIHSPISFI